MGSFILRGITTALLVTVLTLFAGIIWGTMGLGGLSVSQLLDIGLLASCLVGGYRTAKESGVWLMGGVTGAGYVTVGTLLLALFLPIRGWGFVQVLAEGALIGLVAGAFGAGTKGDVGGAWTAKKSQLNFRPSYASYGTDDRVSSEFDWDTDAVSKDNSPGTQRVKRKPDEDSVIEWPWDRENKESKASNLGNSGISETWETELQEDNIVNWERGKAAIAGMEKVNMKKMSPEKESSEKIRDSKPWWEQ